MNLQKSLIVSSTGQAMFGVGGQHVHAMHDYKGYTVSMEWDAQDGEPVMLIWSSISGLGAGVFGICLSSAGKYADPSGKPTEECFVQCAAALPTLGRAMLNLEVSTLVDVVINYMPELLCMPPAPRAVRLGAKGEAMFEVSQENHHGRIVSERLI
jgi:hypothetical protein